MWLTGRATFYYDNFYLVVISATFQSIVAFSLDLQKRLGYQNNGLDLRIPTVPINPDFRIRFVRKSGKTVFPLFPNCGSPIAATD